MTEAASATTTNAQGAVDDVAGHDNEQDDAGVIHEISHQEAMARLLKDDELKDVTLRGNNGVTVGANRCMLAARSDVFHRMFYGNFSESHQATIDLDYSGFVLQSLVEYIYADNLDLDKRPVAANAVVSVDESHIQEQYSMVHDQVTLANAAEFFQLPNLAQKAVTCSLILLQHNPSLACLFLSVCRDFPGNHQTIQDKAWTILRTNPTRSLQGALLLRRLPPTLLEDIVQDQEMAADELQLFQIIHSWAEQETNNDNNITDECEPLPVDLLVPLEDTITNNKAHCDNGEDHVIDDKKLPTTRQEWAMRLIQSHIHLAHIDPANLNSCVRDSGLVTPSQLLDAFAAQALLAHQEHGIVFEKSRVACVWETSQGPVVSNQGNNVWKSDRLLCNAPMKEGGVYTWTILIEESCIQGRRNGGGHIFLGIATNKPGWSTGAFLGDYDDTWVHCSDGRALIHGHIRTGYPSTVVGRPARFDQGSKVTFSLDLRRELNPNADTGVQDRDGVLTSAVDDNEPVLLCHGLLDKIPAGDQKIGFLPIASLYSNN